MRQGKVERPKIKIERQMHSCRQLSTQARHGSYPVQTTGNIKPCLIKSNVVFILGGAENLPQTKIGILSLRCLYDGDVTCDVSGLLKMNSKMGQG